MARSKPEEANEKVMAGVLEEARANNALSEVVAVAMKHFAKDESECCARGAAHDDRGDGCIIARAQAAEVSGGIAGVLAL